MKKVIYLLKKYLVFTFVLGSIMVAWMTFSEPIPTVDLLYIIETMASVLAIAIILVPAIAFVDWFIVRAAISLFKDFKYADRSGRILIIVVSIGLFIKMIFNWNR